MGGLKQVAPLLGKQVYLVNGRAGAGEGSSPYSSEACWCKALHGSSRIAGVCACIHCAGAIQLAPPLSANS